MRLLQRLGVSLANGPLSSSLICSANSFVYSALYGTGLPSSFSSLLSSTAFMISRTLSTGNLWGAGRFKCTTKRHAAASRPRMPAHLSLCSGRTWYVLSLVSPRLRCS